MNFDEKIQQFAKVLEEHQIARLHRDGLACEGNLMNAKTKVVPGKKYVKVNIGGSGKYMVEKETEMIFGIKAYGVVHTGHRYGTLDTTAEYEWGGYSAFKRATEAAGVPA